MRLILLLGLVLVMGFCLSCQPQINSFEECVSAGNPVMESYPRQCRANDQTFVEEIDDGGIIAPPDDTPQGMSEFTECTAAQKEAEICTLEYDPACGIVDNGVRCITAPCASTDAVMYANACGACAAQAFGWYKGTCEEQKFVVCGTEPKTGFDPVEFAENIGGVCVDICPGNFDGYITQIGVEMCIKHYGVEEIAGWVECDRSSTGCECAKAYETTRGDPIDDAKYRCVPEQYGERLLFRGGLDRLDENGQQATMIA